MRCRLLEGPQGGSELLGYSCRNRTLYKPCYAIREMEMEFLAVLG